MGQKSGSVKEPAKAGCEGDPARHPAPVFGGGKIRIVLTGLRGEDSIAELCRREGIVENLYYRWSKEFLEAGKKRLAGDTARAAAPLGKRSRAGWHASCEPARHPAPGERS